MSSSCHIEENRGQQNTGKTNYKRYEIPNTLFTSAYIYKKITKFQDNETSTSDEPPEMKNTNLVKCKGCLFNFEINKIRKHLSHSLSCKEKYTEEEFKELNTMADSYCRKKYSEGKRKKRQKISKEKKKKQKTTQVCHFCMLNFNVS